MIAARDIITTVEYETEDSITIPAGQKVVMVTFDEVEEVEEVKLTVEDADSSNKNSLLMEIMIQKQKGRDSDT